MAHQRASLTRTRTYHPNFSMRLPRPRVEEATAGGLPVGVCVRTARLKTPTAETTARSAYCPCKTCGENTAEKSWIRQTSSVAMLYVLKPSPEMSPQPCRLQLTMCYNSGLLWSADTKPDRRKVNRVECRHRMRERKCNLNVGSIVVSLFDVGRVR